MKKYTISDIARHAGVSASTVSRVLNAERNHVPVSDQLKARIEAAIAKFEYAPNLNAQRLSTNRSYIIGLQLPPRRQLQNIFRDYNFEVTMNGIEEALENSRYKLLLLFQNEHYMEKQEYLQLLKSRSIDGLLIWGALLDDHYDPALANFPAIFLNTTLRDSKQFNYIVHDEISGAYQLTNHLIALGAKRFHYLSGPNANSIVTQRYQGFRTALHNAAIPFDEKNSLHYTPFDRTSAKNIFLSINPNQIDAIVCSTDTLAFGVADAILSQHLPLPLIAGADGIENTANLPILTTQVNHHQLGSLAIQSILKQIEKYNLLQITLPTQSIGGRDKPF